MKTEQKDAGLDLDDVAAQSNLAVIELADLRTELKMLRDRMALIESSPTGVSVGADFDQGTWTFEIGQHVPVSAGRFWLVRQGSA